MDFSGFVNCMENTTIENFDIHEMLATHESSNRQHLITELAGLDGETKWKLCYKKRKMTARFFYYSTVPGKPVMNKFGKN